MRYFTTTSMFPRLDVNVAGSPLERGEDHRIHQPNDRADAGVARELLHGDVFVALFVVSTTCSVNASVA